MLSARRWFYPSRLSEVAHGRDNNLNLIRFVCASGVIFSHSWVMLGLPDPLQRHLITYNIGDIAVRSFFFLSGYLILKSGLQGRDAQEFLAARVLRIFPGLVIAVLGCAFLLGPIVTSLSIRQYLFNPETWKFLREMILYRTQDPLPGVFDRGHYLHQADAVFWTLQIEWAMYIATLFFCFAVKGKAYIGKQPATLVLSVLLAVVPAFAMFPLLDLKRFESCVAYFGFGSVAYLLRKWIFLSIPASLFMLVADVASFGLHAQALGNYLFPFVLGYFLLTFGFYPAVVVKAFHRFGDYSYGLYIFAFPIQQLSISYFHVPWMVLAASYPVTLVAAALSWHFVEKPSLTLKNRIKREHRLPVVTMPAERV